MKPTENADIVARIAAELVDSYDETAKCPAANRQNLF